MSVPASMAALIVLMEHSSACNETHCTRGNECREMKQLIHHLLLCKQPNCKICLEVNGYIQVHASTCTTPNCPVMTCSALKQYALEKERKNSTLSSYSSDLSALESLKLKSKGNGMQPKIRGTYHCGRCGMPKIRPHKCPEGPGCSSTASSTSEDDADTKAMDALVMPKFSDEPETAEFSFCSRRKASVSRSFSFDRANCDSKMPVRERMTVSLDEEELKKARSASLSDPHFLSSAPASPSLIRPPVSPVPTYSGSSGGSSLGGRQQQQMSIELPTRASRSNSYDGQQDNHITLVRKSSETTSLPLPTYHRRSNSMSESEDGTPTSNNPAPAPTYPAVVHSHVRSASVDESEDSTCSSTGSRSRKRLVPPDVFSQLANKRFEVGPNRAVSAQTMPRQVPLNPQYSIPFPQHPPQQCPFPSGAQVPPLRYTSSMYSHQSSASELSDEYSTSSSIEDFDTAEEAAPFSQPQMDFPGGGFCPPNYPPPLLNRHHYGSWMAPPPPNVDFSACPVPPPGAPLVTCYAQTDAFGRTVMIPCWGPLPLMGPGSTTSAAEELGGNDKARGVPAKKSRAKGKLRAGTAATATASSVECSVVSPSKPAQHQQQARALTKRASKKNASNPTPVNTTSSAAAAVPTLATVEMSAELDVDLDAFALDLAGSFSAHLEGGAECAEDDAGVDILEGVTIGASARGGVVYRPYTDEDEEDLFKYLSEEMVGAC